LKKDEKPAGAAAGGYSSATGVSSDGGQELNDKTKTSDLVKFDFIDGPSLINSFIAMKKDLRKRNVKKNQMFKALVANASG
jgi:hypothetical protein